VLPITSGEAAHVLSMVFLWQVLWLQGIWNSGFERPCLAGVLRTVL